VSRENGLNVDPTGSRKETASQHDAARAHPIARHQGASAGRNALQATSTDRSVCCRLFLPGQAAHYRTRRRPS